MKIAKVRGRDLEVFYLRYSESGQRLRGYSTDKVQQSGRGEKGIRKAPHGSKKKKKKQATTEGGFDPCTSEEEAIKTA